MSDIEAERPDNITTTIQVAKAFFLQAFQDEKIENLGLEEIKRDHGDVWNITFGFNRKWDLPEVNNSFLQMAAAAAAARPQRIYKVVTVDLNGPKYLSITNRKDD